MVICAKNYENMVKFVTVMHSKPQTFFLDMVYIQKTTTDKLQ